MLAGSCHSADRNTPNINTPVSSIVSVRNIVNIDKVDFKNYRDRVRSMGRNIRNRNIKYMWDTSKEDKVKYRALVVRK